MQSKAFGNPAEVAKTVDVPGRCANGRQGASAMTAQSEVSKALDEAFRAAFLLTGSTEVAENAVLDGIATLKFGNFADDVLLVETAKSAIQRSAQFPDQLDQAPSHLPLELRRLFLLAPISRDCFVLRVLLGITPGTCSGMLHLTIQETEEVLCAALQELPFLEADSSIRREIIHRAQTQGSSTTYRTTTATECADAKRSWR
jgi:hypothetical protein